jgi:hypothetical protein
MNVSKGITKGDLLKGAHPADQTLHGCYRLPLAGKDM